MHRRHLLAAPALLGLARVARAQGAAVPLSIRLDWRPGAQHAPFYLGLARGLYAAEGVALTVIPGSGSSDAVRQLGARAIDLAVVDGLVLVQAAEQGVPVRSIGAYYQRTPIVLMSPAARPVNAPRDLLRGVKLGAKRGSSTYQGMQALLAANGMTPEQISVVDVGFGVQPLLVGQVDALMGFTMNEPLEAMSAGMPVHEMPIAEHGVHAYGLTLATNTTVLRDHGPAVAGFLRATGRALAMCKAEPDAAVAAVAAAVSETNVARERQVLDRTLPYCEGPGVTPLGQSAEGWGGTIATARTLGLVETAPRPDAVFTTLPG